MLNSTKTQTRRPLSPDLDFPPLKTLLVELPLSTVTAAYERERIAFLITKDHPERLPLTLPVLARSVDRLYVLDSSRGSATKEFCFSLGKAVEFHGPVEQERMISAQPILDQALRSGLITRFSDDSWDIWSKRNYALLISKLEGLSNILIIDDDIIPAAGLIEDVLSLSTEYGLVGSNVTGMPDVSVVGHVCKLVGVTNQDFVSGHFLAINVPLTSQYYFPNMYNEDWVFVMLNSLSARIARFSTVFQLYWNPYHDTAQRLAFEEPGEIFVEGMARALLSQASLAPLSSHEHWQEVIDERGKQLNQLASSELAQAAPAIAQLLTVASAKAQSIAPLDMLSMWQGYVDGLTKWRAIINGAD